MSEWQIASGSIAENYERFLVPTIFAPIAADLLDAVDVRPGDSVLDVACGTGAVARQAAQRVGPAGRVAGIDMLPDMLAQARALKTDPPIEWQQAMADDIPFPDDTFTVVVCQHGLQFFPDRAAALCEMHRVLAPNGKLGLMVLDDISRTPALTALAESLNRNLGPAPAAFVQMIGAMGDEAELRRLVDDSGFRDVRLQRLTENIEFPSPEDFVRQYLVSTPLAANPVVSGADETVRARVESDVRAQLTSYKSGDRWSMRAENYLVTARK